MPEGDHLVPGSSVRVKLESHLPAALPPGCATAIFCYGHCFATRERPTRLELVVATTAAGGGAGGAAAAVRLRPTAVWMPRRDLLEWLRQCDEDPEGRSYRSGFWATVPVHAPAEGAIELAAAVRLAGGRRSLHPLGQIPVRAPEPVAPAWERPLAPGTIAVCLATFDPDPQLLGVQLESLRAQSDERWICLISDDASAPSRFSPLLEATGRDPRFLVSRSDRRLGPYRNFERALRMVPPAAELVALCDQDDRWYPDKLAALRAALGSAQLVYSDQRLVAPDGRVLRESLWRGRRNEHRNLTSVLVANTVPGATMLFRRELLETALPFPDPPGTQYHDHWLALVALSRGELAYVDRPLQDWVQHPAAVSGGGRVPEPAPAGSRGWRAAYFGGYAQRELQAQTLLLRCAPWLTARKRRALERFIAAARSPLAFAWLALRPLRRLAGRGETLGGELALARGIMWRWLIVIAVAGARRPGRRAYDASFPDPPRFEQRRLRRWRTGA